MTEMTFKARPVIINVNPSQKQIDNAEMMGWEYVGDGLFGRGHLIGFYTSEGFKVE